MKLVVLIKGKKRPVGYKTPGGYVKTAKGWRKVARGDVGIATVVKPSSVDPVKEKELGDLTGKYRVNVRRLRVRTSKALVAKSVEILRKISSTTYEVRVTGGKIGQLTLKREGSIEGAHIRVDTKDYDVLGLIRQSEALKKILAPEKKFTEQPNLDKIGAMGDEELATYNAQMFNVAVLDKITNKNRKMWNNITYQIEMLYHLGFKNPSYLAVTIEDAIPSSDPGAIVRAEYNPQSKKITVAKRYKESFVHEYFHHIWHSSLSSKERINFGEVVQATRSYKRFKKLDRGRRFPYYSAWTEVAARFGNQLMYELLKEKGISTASRMVSAPMKSSKDFSDGDFSEVRDKVKQFFKSFQVLPLVVLLKAAHKLQGKMDFQGLPISIENRKGSVRHWYDPMKDEHGETKMYFAYGYIRATKGNDGDSIDCYIGPNKDSTEVFVVHQNNPKTGKFDEDKVMLGFDSAKEAKSAYLKQYDDAKFFGSITEYDIDDFQDKVTRKRKGKVQKIRRL